MYCRARDAWQNVIDISQKLNMYLTTRKWKDVDDHIESNVLKQSNLDETQHRILSRSFFVATTAFVWSAALMGDDGHLHSFIITAQKNGVLILWTAKVQSNLNPFNAESDENKAINIEVSKIFKPKLGMISSLDLIALADETSVLFVGGFNGKIKVHLKLHMGANTLLPLDFF